MTITEAVASAKARSENGDIVAVVKALPGEVYKGFYPEVLTDALPRELVSQYFQYGVRVPVFETR